MERSHWKETLFIWNPLCQTVATSNIFEKCWFKIRSNNTLGSVKHRKWGHILYSYQCWYLRGVSSLTKIWKTTKNVSLLLPCGEDLLCRVLEIYEMNKILTALTLFFVIVGSKIVLEGRWPCNGSYLGNCGVYFVNRGENENSEVSLKRGVWHLLDQGVWDRKLGEEGEQTVAEERWGKVRIVSFKVLGFKQYKLRN